MMTRTRYFVIASLLTLGIGLGVGTLAYYSDSASALSRQGGPDDLRLLPADAALVAYADVRTIMTSQLRERLRSLSPVPPDGQEEFASRTGINIDTDIDQIVAAIRPGAAAGQDGGGVVLARGQFDAVRIEALMREHGAQVEDYKGKRLVVGPANGRQPSLAVAFVEPGFVAIGTTGLVRGAIDLSSGGTGVTGNEAVMNLVRDLDSGDVWAVGRFDALTSQAQLPPTVRDRIPSIQWFSAMASVDWGLRGTLKVEALNEASAASIRDVIQGIMAFAQLQSGSRPELATLLQSLSLGGNGKTVALAFDVPAGVFDLLDSLRDSSRPGVQHPIQ